MTNRTCSVDNCGKTHRARGLCVTHYNAAHRKPNRTASVQCDGCGEMHEREARVTERYAHRYCSQLCRDYSGYGHSLSSRLPKSHWALWWGATSGWKARAHTIACLWCGATSTDRRLSALYCTTVCKMAHKRVKRRGREHHAVGDYTWMDITRLWQVFGKACAYCTAPTPLADIQAEHVVPLSRGGANNRSNLLPSCAPCNSDKRDLLLSEWNTDRARRGLPLVITSWGAEDEHYAHLVTDWTSVLLSA